MKFEASSGVSIGFNAKHYDVIFDEWKTHKELHLSIYKPMLPIHSLLTPPPSLVMMIKKQILVHTTCIVFLLTAIMSCCCYLYVDLYSICCCEYNPGDIVFNISKAIISICSTGTNLSYPAICGPIDDKWFGVRVLSVGLALEFNAEVHPLLTQNLQPGIEQQMRLSAAVSYHRTFKLDLNKAISYAAREQRAGLRRVSAALDEASERFVSRQEIVKFVSDSMYNAFWMQEEGVATTTVMDHDNINIKPETWAFVTRVLNSLKKEWLLRAEEALDNVHAGLCRRDAAVYDDSSSSSSSVSNDSEPTTPSTLYEKMVSLASNVLVLRSSDGSDSSSALVAWNTRTDGLHYYYYEPVLSDKWLTFIAEMVVLLGSVRALALVA